MAETEAAKTPRWKIALREPVGTTPVYFWVDQKTELLFIEDQKKLRAFQSLCPHMGARLLWDAKKKRVHCPWHALSFCATSKKSNHPVYQKIREYEARCVKNMLEIYDL